MACDKWIEHIVGSLYGELDAEDAALLEEHLQECADCREEVAAMNESREQLRLAEPQVPYAPRVVVLPSPIPRFGSWWGFAAGFACAVVLLAAGVAAGWRMAPGEQRPAEGDQAQATMQLSDNLVTKDYLKQELETLAASMPANRDRDQYLDSKLQGLATTLDQRRRDDLRFILEQLVASEMRNGVAIDETQQAVRYLAVANDPRMTEW